ncbi:MAG: methyltransferase domain-containing protein [Acetobacteraceae bacterium]
MNDSLAPMVGMPANFDRYDLAARHPWLQMNRPPDVHEMASFLDNAADMLSGTDTIPAIWAPLFAALRRLQMTASDATWFQPLRQHRIAELLHEAPPVAWSFRKPRGYAGDAHLIDFLYEHQAARAEIAAAPARAQAMAAMVLCSSASVAVQERRRLLARWLDATAARTEGAEALILACGHLRELELTYAAERFSRIVALDQDPQSADEIQRCYAGLTPLYPVTASVGRMIVRPLVHGRFDLIYAAGLYDYLDDRTAARLTQGMLAALKPGGRLLFANFCHDVVDYGFMETFMDWRLITRDEPEMRRLIHSLPSDQVADASLFRGLNRAVIYALIEKRA